VCDGKLPKVDCDCVVSGAWSMNVTLPNGNMARPMFDATTGTAGYSMTKSVTSTSGRIAVDAADTELVLQVLFRSFPNMPIAHTGEGSDRAAAH